MARLVPPRSFRGFFIVVGSVAGSPVLSFFIRDINPERCAVPTGLLQQKATRAFSAGRFKQAGDLYKDRSSFGGSVLRQLIFG